MLKAVLPVIMIAMYGVLVEHLLRYLYTVYTSEHLQFDPLELGLVIGALILSTAATYIATGYLISL